MVASSTKLWLLGGSRSDTTIYASTDGVLWSRYATNGPLSRSWMGVVIFNNRLWITGGLDANGRVCRDVWSSTNGASWGRVTSAPAWPARYGHCALVFGGKLFVLGGTGATNTALRDVWSSTNGITWTQVTATAGWAGMTNFAAFEFGGRLWVVGDGAAGTEVWVSDNGASWTRTATLAGLGSRYAFAAAVQGGRMWVFGGIDYAITTGNTLCNDVWSSADGVSWTRSSATVPWSARYGHAAAVLGNKIWLSGGNTSASGVSATRDVWKLTN